MSDKTIKVVINDCWSGFGISDMCWEYMEKNGYTGDRCDIRISRTDKYLIRAIESIGTKACSARCAKLLVVEVPCDIEWQIECFDGLEWVAEKHRTWGNKPE